MITKDKRIDAYIAKSAPFAQPILKHIRELVHTACPDVEEKIKWGFPHFDYKGEMMCSMAAFKEHAAFGFWKTSLLKDPKKLLVEDGMGAIGKIRSLKDLPSDKELSQFIKQAMGLNDTGVKAKRTIAKKEIIVDPPDYFLKALKKNKAALKTFEAFSPGNKREYVVWVTEAKAEETRNKRLETAIEWMAEGKIRNWKYVKK